MFHSTKERVAMAVAAGALILYVSGLALVAFLCAISVAMSFLAGKAKIRSIGIELVTFSAVACGVVYGPVAGAIAALFLMSVHLLFGGYSGPYMLWVLPVYVVIGFAAGVVGGSPSSVGPFLSLAANVINVAFTWLFSRQFVVKFLPFAASNIVFNVLIFRLFSGALPSA